MRRLSRRIRRMSRYMHWSDVRVKHDVTRITA